MRDQSQPKKQRPSLAGYAPHRPHVSVVAAVIAQATTNSYPPRGRWNGMPFSASTVDFATKENHMAIVIIAPDLDEHVDCIEWGLKQSGLDVIRWRGLGWESERSASITFGMDDGIYLGDHRIEPADTVWIRRPSTVAHPGVAPDEAKFASSEYQAFRKTLLMNIELMGAFCINNWSAANWIENKSVQLTLAKKCGLTVPATVMTNSARFVRELRDTAGGDVIHKSYLAHSWVHESSGVTYVCETTRLQK